MAGRPSPIPTSASSLCYVARCSVADRWPSDGAVEDVEPRPDPDDAPVAQTDRHGYRRAHAKRRSSRCSQGLFDRSLEGAHARFSADPRGLAKQHRCSWGSSSVSVGGAAARSGGTPQRHRHRPMPTSLMPQLGLSRVITFAEKPTYAGEPLPSFPGIGSRKHHHIGRHGAL
jgi:hypothetical protein